MARVNKAWAFFIGVAAGLFIMAGAVFGFDIYKRHTRWMGNQEPNRKVMEILGVLDQYFIDPYEADTMLDNMYRGFVDGTGDPYTYYFDEKSLVTFNEQSEGVYAGIGVVVTVGLEDDLVTVITVYPNTPGERAGLMPGDKFIAVNGLDITNARLEEVTAMTKGTPGTNVTLTLLRSGADALFEVVVTREFINIPTVSHKMLEDDIGYIRIEAFDRVTYGQFIESLAELEAKAMRGLIIDLRNNPGGLLDTVTQIADSLLPKGVILYTEDKWGERKYYYSDDNSLDLPLAILVNGNSASASELLSGAVRDLEAGVLVGTKTFGKGVVQNLIGLSDGSAMKVTVAKYYTPNGVCLQGDGLTPDYIVEVEKEISRRAGSLPAEDDAQLQKAIEVMKDYIALQ